MGQLEILAYASLEELKDLLLWFHHQGPTPIVIGGWAVYFYNPYLGSADIGLVGPSMGGLFDSTLEGIREGVPAGHDSSVILSGNPSIRMEGSLDKQTYIERYFDVSITGN